MGLSFFVMSSRVPRRRFVPGNFVRDRRKVGLQILDACQHLVPMRRQHFAPGIVGRIALRAQCGKRLDGSDRHPGRLQAHDELQPIPVRWRIQPVSGLRATDGTQQPSPLVVT